MVDIKLIEHKKEVRKLVAKLSSPEDCEKAFNEMKTQNAPLWFLGAISARHAELLK